LNYAESDETVEKLQIKWKQ